MLSAIEGLIGWIPLGLPAFLFVITIVVFFHELGHFLVARACGVTIDSFSIGFGPAIASWTDRKGTRWKISWIPLGGYVRFMGDLDPSSKPDREALNNMSEADRAGAFPLKPLYQRALVAAAGPFANFVLAIAIFTGIFMTAGVIGSLGTKIGAVQKGEPAAAAGIKPGDRIVSINGKHVDTFAGVVDIIHRDGTKPMTVVVRRASQLLTIHLKPHTIPVPNIYGGTDHKTGIGVIVSSDPDNSTFVRLGPIAALGQASKQVWFVVKTTVTYLGMTVTGHANPDQLSGPVTIAAVSHQVAETGFLNLLGLAAFLSVSIGLVNLFPIPVLDGGHLLYYACEAILGRPLKAQAQDMGFRLGLAVIFGLFVFATWNDLVRLNLF